MKHPAFRLIAAPFTPMNGDGSLNLSRVADQSRYYLASGVRGIFIAGTSGEGQSLTGDERIALAETWAHDANRSKLEFVVHVGHNSQAEAARLAAHAQSVGADAVAMHAPTWFKGQSLAGLVDFAAGVAAAAPRLPFYYYDIPSITGVHLSAAEFLKCGKEKIPTLKGIKYTNPDCVTAQECLQFDSGSYDVLWGTDEILLIGVTLGATGAVGSTYNFAAPLYLRMLAALDSGDLQTARAEQARAVAMVRVFTQFTPLAALKYGMALAGVDCGPLRSPVGNLTDADKAKLRRELAAGEYFAMA